MHAKHLGTLLVCVSALLASAVAAYAKTYKVPVALGTTLQRTDDRTPLAILLPRRLALDFDGRTYAFGSGGRRSYGLSLSGAPNCGGAKACFWSHSMPSAGAALTFAGPSPCAADAPATSSH